MGILLIIVLLAFAQNGTCQTEISLPRPFGDNFIESELIEEVTYIPLQEEKMGMITYDMELRYENDFYFILDNKFTQCVYRYNPEGELINKICEKKGNEGNDLPLLNNPANFNINPYYEQVEIFNFQESVVKRYSYNGTKIDQIPFPINPADFTRDNDGNYWIYTGWNNPDTQYKLIKCDKNGKIIDRKMRLVTRCFEMAGYSFSINNDEILMWESLGNSTYSIKNDNITESYNFFFGINNLPPNFHILDARES
ncbi:MAG: 6-bladed beta-propeller, partial [Prolixibacteraceae bacterium]|nr:6-bladed beta-propeller [Prolixibacteraceae bacterium]